MPNVATVLKEEISRVARKEVRNQTEWMKKAATQYRRDVADLKRRVATLQRQLSHYEKAAPGKPATQSQEETVTRHRFTAKGLRSQRLRLGLSAGNFARLVGVSPKSIYDWERGTARPRKGHLAVLASLRGIGKREARTRLEQLDEQKMGPEQKS
jgi:DNA-binding transcriptional regulator YiaG